MEKYFCIFSDLGTIRKDFYFKTKEDYMSFLLSNKKEIIWQEKVREIEREFRRTNSGTASGSR